MTTEDQVAISQAVFRALAAEIELNKRYLWFRVLHRERKQSIWELRVEPDNPNTSLDEGLEGSRVFWKQPSGGLAYADALAIVPETRQLTLRYCRSAPPPVGETLALIPPLFLEPLDKAWHKASWRKRALRVLRQVRYGSNRTEEPATKAEQGERPLRARQAEAQKLIHWRQSYLWGPPGTGKTYTLGVLCARALAQREGRLLLLSTTNRALDQAMVSVDDALRANQRSDLQHQCKRIGTHFRPEFYSGRPHLLPSQDDKLLKELLRLEEQRPEKSDSVAFASWSEKVEEIRREMKARERQMLEESRLIAMTTTRAAFSLDLLRGLGRSGPKYKPPFDLVLFDEASQVSVVHALALSPLGRRALYAGDPKQLGPIVQSKDVDAQRWLGRSMFSFMGPSPKNATMLNEQSRMTAPICRLVSETFYSGELVVAEDAKSSKRWHRHRRLRREDPFGGRSVVIQQLVDDGTWSPKLGGPIRSGSAAWIAETARRLRSAYPGQELLILTPFRAQRVLIRMKLRELKLRDIVVSTVHRAQGAEHHTILFDPVDASNKFLIGELGQRLINVAISRAQARAIICISDLDLQNPTMQRLLRIHEWRDEGQPKTNRFIDVSQLVALGGFPERFVGEQVQVGSYKGVLGGTRNQGTEFSLHPAKGRVRWFRTSAIRSAFSVPRR